MRGAEGLPGKLAGGCRLLAIGMIPPEGWIKPKDCLRGLLLPLEPLTGHLLGISPSAMVFSVTSQGNCLFLYSPRLTPD